MKLLDIDFTKENSKDTFYLALQKLISLGLNEDDARHMLEDLWYAVADEYGD